MIVDMIGRRGLGKTTLALYLSRNAEIVIALDPRNLFPIGDAGLVYDPSALEADDLEALIGTKARRIVVRPTGVLQDAVDTLAGDVKALLEKHPTLRVTVILDEAGTFELEAWNYLFRTADRDRVWFMLTCHRPTDVEPWVRAIADWIIVFRTTEQNDLRALRERCGDAFAEHARRLNPREWLLWDDTTSDERKQVKFFNDPKVWFVALETRAASGSDASALPISTDLPRSSREPSLL